MGPGDTDDDMGTPDAEEDTPDGGMVDPVDPCQEEWCQGSEDAPDDAICIDEYSRYWPSVTVTGAEGRLERFSDIGGEPVVVDRLSNTMWTGCVLGITGDECTNGNYQSTRPNAVAQSCAALIWGGHSDWEAPAPEAASALLNYNSRPVLNPQAFPNQPIQVWAVVTLAPSAHYGIDVRTGAYHGGSGFALCARPADGVPRAPTVRRCFASTRGQVAEPVIEDLATGVVWQGCLGGTTGAECAAGTPTPTNFDQARAYCENLNWGGHDNWTIPSLEQMRSASNIRPGIAPLFHNSTYTVVTSTFEPGRGFVGYMRADLGKQISIAGVRQTSASRCVLEGGRWARPVVYPTQSCRTTLPAKYHSEIESDGRFSPNRDVGGEPVVVDAAMEVQWTACLLGQTGDTCANGAPSPAFDGVSDQCRNLDWGGHTDWRLPSLVEVRTLVEPGAPNWPDDVRAMFPALLPNTVLITSTQSASNRWVSQALSSNGTTSSGFGVCVRDPDGMPIAPQTQCLDTTTWVNAEPTITDARSGLQWRGCISGHYGRGCLEGSVSTTTYIQAQTSCEDLNWAGQQDWRLPTIHELNLLSDARSLREFRFDPFALSHHSYNHLFDQVWSSTQTPEGNRLVNPFLNSAISPNGSYYWTCVRDL
jgi:hypothetical protein